MKTRRLVFQRSDTPTKGAAKAPVTPLIRKDQRGFALIATMLMMVLILVVAIGLLSLGTISLRTTANEDTARIARGNARLALNLALADLQKHLGNDRRVTADGALLNANAQRPGLAGVWESVQNNLPDSPLGSAPDYNGKKFVSWLVSTQKPEDATNRDLALSDASGEAVALFGEETDGSKLSASLVTLKKNNKTAGGLAWAVSQAATKASINAGTELAHTRLNEQLGAPDRPNLSLSEVAQHPESGWKERRSRVLDMNQALLDSGYAVSPDKKAALAAEHTTQSLGVLADVSKGGLKTDMSLGFELSDEEFARRNWDDATNPFQEQGMPGNEKRLYQNVGSPGTVNLDVDYDPVKYRMAMDTGTPPTFNSLRSYYSLYKHMYMSGGTPTARQRFQASPSYDNAGANAPRGSETSVNPVLDRVLLYFSLVTNGRNLGLTITPVITLWNPYNVAIEADGYVAFPYMDIPLNITIKSNGSNVLGPDNFSRFMGRGYGEGWSDPGHGRQAEPYFFCKITKDGNSSVSSPVRLEPGEVRLFSPATSTRTTFGRTSRDDNMSTTAGRTIWMKPLGNSGSDAIIPNGGLLINFSDRSGGGGTTVPASTGNFSVNLGFESTYYNYFLSLEDGTRIKNPGTASLANIPRITETQLLRTQLGSTSIASPTITSADIAGTKAKVFAVLETYHRTAGAQGTVQPADIVYTVNPRQRHTNYMISGASNMPNAHYSSAMRAVSDIGADVQNFSGRSFYGMSNSPATGRDILSFFELPQAPMMSLASFQGADLSNSAFSSSAQFGNSWASPYIELGKTAKLLSNATSVNTNALGPNGLGLYDHSYLLNSALWDGFFFSSIAPETTIGYSGSGNAYDTDLSRVTKGMDRVVSEWIEDPEANPLRNRRHLLHRGGLNAEDLEKKLLDPSGCRDAAAHILVDGSFNVNSVNEKAWRAMFASLRGKQFEIDGGKSNHSSGSKTPASRMINPSGQAEDLWNGFRELDDTQIRDLAKEMVVQVRTRGPFQSLGEFVNRRLTSDDNGKKGALQTAIDRANINRSASIGTFATTGYPYSGNISENNTGVGTPGWLTQADVLNALGPFISVRSDTFTIRAYGDARDQAGKVVSRCMLEAQVQRVPEWVDPTDKASAAIDSLTTVNKNFGRKFEIVAIREISSQEMQDIAEES